jgi:hypothetical protein
VPSRRPSSSGPLPIGRVVSRLLARTGYDRERAADGLAEAWGQACPDILRQASRAGLVKRGVLEVFVTHSALVQEFGFHRLAVLERMRTLLPAAGIVDIRCRLLPDAGVGEG